MSATPDLFVVNFNKGILKLNETCYLVSLRHQLCQPMRESKGQAVVWTPSLEKHVLQPKRKTVVTHIL